MKRLLCLSVLALSMSAFSQSSFVVRPSLGNPELTDGSGKDVQSSTVGVGTVIKVSIPVYNNSFAVAVRAGSGRLEIDLGSVKSGVLDVVALPVSTVFSWEKPAVRGDGHIYLIGRLVSNLGTNYVGNEILVLKASESLNTMLRARWVDTAPTIGKRADIFAEMQVQTVGSAGRK